MAPNEYVPSGVLFETDKEEDAKGLPIEDIPKPREYKIVWWNVTMHILLHLSSLYAIYLMFTSAKVLTSLFTFVMVNVANLGITCGIHRLWSHRTYKAKLPLQLLLLAMQTMAFQHSVIDWARDHRVHHKFNETDADPHNPRRGFFYAHIGWLLVKKHPQVLTKGKTIDLSDLTSDPLLKFQRNYYLPLMVIFAFVIPVATPMYLWNESFSNAFYLNLLRYCLGLHIVWMVNSVAHKYGGKPYDKNINPAENLFVSVVGLGEGWHNYHHAFPWDYKTAELGQYSTNLSTAFIDFFAKIGWAYDLKVVSDEMIKKRILRTGDGTHHVWGWKDKDMVQEDIDDTVILKKDI